MVDILLERSWSQIAMVPTSSLQFIVWSWATSFWLSSLIWMIRIKIVTGFH